MSSDDFGFSSKSYHPNIGMSRTFGGKHVQSNINQNYNNPPKYNNGGTQPQRPKNQPQQPYKNLNFNPYQNKKVASSYNQYQTEFDEFTVEEQKQLAELQRKKRMMEQKRRQQQTKFDKQFMEDVSRETTDPYKQQRALQLKKQQMQQESDMRYLKSIQNKKRVPTTFVHNPSTNCFETKVSAFWRNTLNGLTTCPKGRVFRLNDMKMRKNYLSCLSNTCKDNNSILAGRDVQDLCKKTMLAIKGCRLLKTRSDYPVDLCADSNSLLKTWDINNDNCTLPIYSSGNRFIDYDDDLNEGIEKSWDSKSMDKRIKILGPLDEDTFSIENKPTEVKAKDGTPSFVHYIHKDHKFIKAYLNCRTHLGDFNSQLKLIPKGDMYNLDVKTYKSLCGKMLRLRRELPITNYFTLTLRRPNCTWEDNTDLYHKCGGCQGETRSTLIKSFRHKPCNATALLKLKYRIVGVKV